MTSGLITALVLAAMIGVSLGMLGSGGSIVTLPIMVYVAGIPVQTAVGMSLVVVGATSLVGSVLHYRQGNFYLRAAVFFGVAGMGGAYFASALTHRVSESFLMLFFAALMLTAGAAMLRVHPESLKCGTCSAPRCLLLGSVVGILTGFLGVGGGFLIVPSLVLFTGLDTKRAAGTSLAVIALNSASGAVGQLRFSEFDWPLTWAFLSIALLGMWGGTIVAGRLQERTLRKLFAWAVIVVAVVIIGVTLVRAWGGGVEIG